jgi:hypothetical protein
VAPPWGLVLLWPLLAIVRFPVPRSCGLSLVLFSSFLFLVPSTLYPFVLLCLSVGTYPSGLFAATCDVTSTRLRVCKCRLCISCWVMARALCAAPICKPSRITPARPICPISHVPCVMASGLAHSHVQLGWPALSGVLAGVAAQLLRSKVRLLDVYDALPFPLQGAFPRGKTTAPSR